MLPSVSAYASNAEMTVQTDKQVYEYLDQYNQEPIILVSGWIDPSIKSPKDNVQQIHLYVFDENNTAVCPSLNPCLATEADMYTGKYQFHGMIVAGYNMLPGKHYTVKTIYYNYSASTTIYLDDTRFKQFLKEEQQYSDAKNKQLQTMINDTMTNPISGKASLLILCPSSDCGTWQGSVLDSNQVQQSISGYYDDKYDFDCAIGGTYSLTVQKLGGILGDSVLIVIQNGKVLKSGHTDASHGLVSLAGSCDSVSTPEFGFVSTLALALAFVSIVVISMKTDVRYSNTVS